MAKTSRNREQLNEAASTAWQAQQESIHLRRRLANAENRITALENVLVEQLQIPRATLQAACDKAGEEHAVARKAEDCPACGRPLQEHTRACIYCGHIK